VKDRIVFEGSYELTPFFQRDVNRLRVISPRLLIMLLVSGGLLALVWVLTGQSQPELYQVALGAMILVQLAVHTRHLRNFFLFRAVNSTDAIRGRMEYSRALLLQMSSHEWLAFSALFFVLFVFTRDWFTFGGVVGCLSLAAKHRRLASKLPATVSSTEQSGCA